MSLPTPEKINAASRAQGGMDVFQKITDKTKFREMGGRTGDEKPPLWGTHPQDERWVVTQPAAFYGNEFDDVEGVLEAGQAYADLVEEYWSLTIWDRQKNEGWYLEFFGPGWLDVLRTDYPEAFVGVPKKVTGKASVGAVDPNDIQTINQHRARIGGKVLDLADGWNARELHEMAENIRSKGSTYNNPGRRGGAVARGALGSMAGTLVGSLAGPMGVLAGRTAASYYLTKSWTPEGLEGESSKLRKIQESRVAEAAMGAALGAAVFGWLGAGLGAYIGAGSLPKVTKSNPFAYQEYRHLSDKEREYLVDLMSKAQGAKVQMELARTRGDGIAARKWKAKYDTAEEKFVQLEERLRVSHQGRR